jgi:hypothetical protein
MKTLVGTFYTDHIITIEGEKIPCYTFGRVFDIINNKKGIFNLKKANGTGPYIIFQYVLLENNEFGEYAPFTPEFKENNGEV